jgi:hypothetical protein
MFFALRRKRKKDERKKKFLVPTDVFEFFFGRRSQSSAGSFFFRVRGFSFSILGHEFNSDTCRLLRRTSGAFNISNEENCGTKRASACVVRVLFCLQRLEYSTRGLLLRAHSLAHAERATRRSSSAATLFARARARCGKFKPVTVLFFFSNDNVLKK